MRLKDFRKSNSISQKEIAELFACTQGHISCIETGIRNITTLQLRLLIERYGIDRVQPFIDESDRMPSASSITINAPKISNNTAPVNAGDGIQVTQDDVLISLLKQQADQIDRLITLLEHKYLPDN